MRELGLDVAPGFELVDGRDCNLLGEAALGVALPWLRQALWHLRFQLSWAQLRPLLAYAWPLLLVALGVLLVLLLLVCLLLIHLPPKLKAGSCHVFPVVFLGQLPPSISRKWII